MKLISLNIWGGRVYKPLIKFIKIHSKDVDVFCFQEVFHTELETKEDFGYRLNILSELSKVLGDFNIFFDVSVENYLVGSFKKNFTSYKLSSGLATFIRRNIEVKSNGSFFIYGKKNNFNPKDRESLQRNAQYIIFRVSGREFTVLNVHGLWTPTKLDTPSRIKQSNKIKSFLDKQKGSKIVCGDFNLSPDTKSIEILETDLRNLIKDFNIKTTRNPHYPGNEKHADYIFTSPEIKVKDFKILPDIISDHLPLYLEFN